MTSAFNKKLDYSNYTNLDNNSTFTCPSDGALFCGGQGGNSTSILVDGACVAYGSSGDWSPLGASPVPVYKGNIIKTTHSYNAVFVPFK